MPWGYVAAIVAAALWGALYIVEQRVLRELPLWHYVFITSLFGLMVSTVAGARDFAGLPPSRDLPAIGLALLLSSAASLLTLFAITRIGGLATATLQVSYPVFALTFAALAFRERVPASAILAAVLCGLGAWILISRSPGAGSQP